jgi:hypothetical protein
MDPVEPLPERAAAQRLADVAGQLMDLEARVAAIGDEMPARHPVTNWLHSVEALIQGATDGAEAAIAELGRSLDRGVADPPVADPLGPDPVVAAIVGAVTGRCHPSTSMTELRTTTSIALELARVRGVSTTGDEIDVLATDAADLARALRELRPQD